MHPYQSHMLAEIKTRELRQQADSARRYRAMLPARSRRGIRRWFESFSIQRPRVQGEQLVDVLLRVREDGSRAWAVLDYEGDHFEAEGAPSDEHALPALHLRREAAILNVMDQLRASLTTSIASKSILRAS